MGSLFQRPENQYREKRHYIDLTYSNDLTDRLDLTASLSYNRYMWSDHILYNYGSLERRHRTCPGRSGGLGVQPLSGCRAET